MDTVLIIAMVAAGAGVAAGLVTAIVGNSRRTEAKVKLDAAMAAAFALTNGAKPTAWDVAMEKIGNYIDRNLTQVGQIFWVSIVIMFLGFVLVAWGAYRCLNGIATTPAILSAVAGTITEFIGATFLFVYKATLKQAETFMAMLEKINRVGMALDVVNSMVTSGEKEKALTRITERLLDFSDIRVSVSSSPDKPKTPPQPA